ncbi:Cupredoxin [Parasitella parasitica]|nr:Cupredoxin [Parasitella parasitica]
MKKLLFYYLILFLIVTVNTENDYFDLLQDEFKATPTGQVRRFYITVEEGVWDYASEMESSANVPDTSILGTRYYKALYHEYEDSSFTEKKKRFNWQGNMGPILRAEVGDVIQVFFWNRATRNYTMHPHGIFYEFEMEGAIFKGSYEESSIEPNQNYTYTWNVLPRAGPGPKDGNSIVWGYHSHVSETDIYAGLYGAIVVYKADSISNEQIVTSVFVGDENLSPYIAKTMSSLYPNFDRSKYDETEIYKANQFNCINGLVSSAPKDLIVKDNTIDWHLLGWGTYWDVKYIKWENSQASWNDETVDYIRLMPASFYTATIKPLKHNGQFKFGALDNEKDGMIMKYKVSL